MTKSSTAQALSDPAVILTLSYMESIERCLKIIFNNQQEPVCLHDEVSGEDIACLKSELRELLASDSGARAIKSSKEFGRDHIQSIAFGHADNLDALVKLGFLCGERVVLWDIVSSRILVASERADFSVDTLVEAACNLLLLRPIVRLGGLVVLPHPLTWSQLAQKAARELNLRESRSPYALGLTFAVVAIEEGIPLHPYAMFRQNENAYELEGTNVVELSIQNIDYQAAIASLLKEPDFQFLVEVPAAAFFNISRQYPDLHRSLRKHFSSLTGLTIQQRTKESLALVQALRVSARTRDKAVSDYLIDAGLATTGLVAGALTLATSVAGATMLAGLGLAPTAISVIRRWFNRPDRPVVVQAFSELQALRPLPAELVTSLPQITWNQPDAEIEEHIESLMNLTWTEDKHQYLSKLDDDLSRRVIEALLPEQIQILVNYRKFQEDYIGDYLEYLWEVSELAFWRHIEQTFLSNDGMLLYDGTRMHEILTSYDMPISVWVAVLNAVHTTYKAPILTGLHLRYKQEAGQALAELQVELLLEVLAFQLDKSSDRLGKQRAFVFWLSSHGEESREIIAQLLAKLFVNGHPDWLSPKHTSEVL